MPIWGRLCAHSGMSLGTGPPAGAAGSASGPSAWRRAATKARRSAATHAKHSSVSRVSTCASGAAKNCTHACAAGSRSVLSASSASRCRWCHDTTQLAAPAATHAASKRNVGRSAAHTARRSLNGTASMRHTRVRGAQSSGRTPSHAGSASTRRKHVTADMSCPSTFWNDGASPM